MERVLFLDISFGRRQEVLHGFDGLSEQCIPCIFRFWTSYLVFPTEQIKMLGLAFSL